jgi:hypothetical protein
VNRRLACCLVFSSALVALSGLLGVAMSACTNATNPNSELEGGGIPVPMIDSGGRDTAVPPPLCPPVDAASFAPTWHPPAGPNLGACTDAQLSALIPACFETTSTTTTCGAWLYDPTNSTCLACWQGSVGAATWAPFVHVDNPGEADYVNIGGCVALADPPEIACAHSIQAQLECEMASCLTHCAVPDPDAGAAAHASALTVLQSCYDYVDRTECESYVAAVSECAAPLEVDGGPVGFCFSANGNNSDLLRLFTLACGGDAGVPPDGGEASSDGGADGPEDAPDAG